MRELLADADRRRQLHSLIERLLGRADEVLGRWAGVMPSSAASAEIIDHHVELYSRVAWVGSLLEYFEPTDDDPNWRPLTRSSPAVQLQGEFDHDWLSHNLVAIAQLAEALDEGSLQLALRIVPGEWWTARRDKGAGASRLTERGPGDPHLETASGSRLVDPSLSVAALGLCSR